MCLGRRARSFLKRIDSFGQPILLSYKGETEYRTWFGGFLTLFLLGTIIFFSLDAITSLILRENISVALSTVYEKDPYRIEVSGEKNFHLAIGLYPDIFNNASSRYFNIYAEQRVYRRFSNGTEGREYMQLQLKPCQKENFPRDYNYVKYNQNNWYCLDKSQALVFEGNFQSDIYRHVKVGVDRCRNTSTDSTCAPVEVTEELIKSNKIYLNAVFTNKLINLQNYNNPISDFMETSINSLLDPNKYYKQVDIFMRHNTILVDDNIWLYNKKTTTEVTFDGFREQVMDVNSDRLAALFFQSSSNRAVHDAKVEKLTLMLSRLGGLISVLYSVIEVIARLYNRKRLLVSLANFLYNFLTSESKGNCNPKDKAKEGKSQASLEDEGKNKLSDLKIMKKITPNSEKLFFKLPPPGMDVHVMNEKNAQPEKISTDFEHTKCERNPWNGRLTQSIKKYLSQFSKLDLSWNFPFLLIRKDNRLKLKEQKELFHKAIGKIDRDLDIIQILETVKGIEKLKDFLFKEHQRILFEFFPKPTISCASFDLNNAVKPKRLARISKTMGDGKRILRNEYLMKMININRKSLDEETCIYQELFKAFKTATQDPVESLDTNNRKLVNFLGDNLLNIFRKTNNSL